MRVVGVARSRPRLVGSLVVALDAVAYALAWWTSSFVIGSVCALLSYLVLPALYGRMLASTLGPWHRVPIFLLWLLAFGAGAALQRHVMGT